MTGAGHSASTASYQRSVEENELRAKEYRMQIRVGSPVYFSQNDETAMFEWFGRISVVEDVSGEGRDLIIRLKQPPTDDQLRDLIALFFRYQIDMTPLAALLTAKNESWFSDKERYWFDNVFKETEGCCRF